MPSTFTNNGGIELPADGEKDGVWGDVVNLNMQIVDRLTNGVGAVSLTGTTHTLTTANGVLSDGQYALVVFGGAPTGTNTVTISPNDAEKVFFIRNTTAQSVIMTQGSGGDVTIPSGAGAIVYANGAGTGAAVADLTATFVFSLTQAGITATPAELNILDGATLSTAELNYVDGVTSAIQTQLDGKQATITGAATTIASSDLTTSRALVSNGSGKVAVSDVTAAELAVLDGITATTDELNRVAGVTSPIQTQLDTKAPLASPALTGTPTGPTAAAATNTTQLATTAFVQQETPELTQVQVEDDTSTVFGQVSGQRLAQAVAANVDPVDTSSVLSAMAGASAGAIGSVAFLRSSVSSDAAFGSTLAGSNLTPAGIASSGSALSTRASSSGSTQSGTWRCLGFSDWVNLDTDLDGFTLWLRIS